MSETLASTRRSWLDRLWGGIADRGRAFATVPDLGVSGVERARGLAAALLSERGEASGAAVARELLACLRAMSAPGRLEVLRTMAAGFGPDADKLREAAQAYLADPTLARATRLHQASEPARQELLRRMNMAPGGTAMLVAMRRELLAHLRQDASLRPLDHDLRHLFASWFNRGFLELRRIDWETPASILEKLIRYEAVHEIEGWNDLRRRLLPDRRCFAFFHQALPNDPLIFVEVALTRGLADAVQPLLAPVAEEQTAVAGDADTAIFYSISNCQEGLRGVSFGNFLIKQVVEELKAELPALKRFATLSPVPGFAAWLAAQAEEGQLAEDESEAFAATRAAGWWRDDQAGAGARAAQLKPALLRLAATYLTRQADAPGFDPVAKFHLGNGARLERVNWLGNTAERGLRESLGVMVNYLYDPEKIEANHEAFVHTGRVARSAEVDVLMRKPRKPARPANAGQTIEATAS
jgi:malonyl-CoA decarboxylase